MLRRTAPFIILAATVFLGGSGVSASTLGPTQDKKEESAKQEDAKAESAEERGQERTTRKILSRILRNFKNGFEGLSPSFLRELVEEEKFYDYPRFEDGVTDFLRSAGEMRLFTREVNVQVKEDKAVMIIEVEMAYASREDPSRRQQRRSRITFDFLRTDDGWKITEINPRPFFLP